MTHIGSGPCSPHNNAVSSGHALLKQPCHIENVIVVKDKEKAERNRLRLKVSIAVVKWLTFQACAFRGHDERPQSKNQGNFLEMVKLLAEFNPEIAKVVMGNAPYGAKYTSHDIQNEILSIFACKIREHIREEIGDYKYSILVDETCDASKREHMALVLRFADKGGILQERFFDLIHVANTRSLTLKDELSFVLSNNGFDIQNLRGQGYDGASNMRVSTASAERAFSSMKIIKTRLRNKMEDENLANNLLVHIEGGILENYSHEDVIADFISKKDRRVDF